MKIFKNAILLCLFSGCAYHIGPTERHLPTDAKSISVTMFENRTQEVGIESEFTDAFTLELARSGVGTVSNQGQGDLTLHGVIHTVDFLGTTSRSMTEDLYQNNASLFTEYTTRVTIVLKALDRNNKEVWQGQFSGEKNYKAPQLTKPGLRTANPLYNQSARRQVVKMIAKSLAEEAVGRMTENF